jgi:hypothetical protein
LNQAQLKNLVEIIGISAIVASLVFVGLELRQSHQIAIAAEYQGRNSIVNDLYNTRIQSETALSVVGQPLYDSVRSADFPDKYRHMYEGYTVEQLGYISTQALISLTNFDNLYFQYQSGFISDEAWQAFRYRLRRELESPVARLVFEKDPNWYRTSYRKLVSEILNEIESDRESP